MKYQNNLDRKDPEPKRIEPVGTDTNLKGSIDETKEGNNEKEIIKSEGERVKRIVEMEW